MSLPTPKALQQMYRLNTSAMFPALLDIEHSTIPGGVLHLVNNATDLVYDGVTYTASSFKYTPPKYSDKKMGDGSITISAIDQTIITLIRGLSSRARARVIASFYFDNFGTLLFEPIEEWVFTLTQVNWNDISATWQMKYDTRMDILVPCDKMSAQKCPGIA